jgi:DNA gyrase subunit A
MAQNFAVREVMVDGYGNFGSIDGDAPAAYRYTECRLTPYSDLLLEDLKRMGDCVHLVDNFDNTCKEPFVLPNSVPNILINGGSGIAVGIATNIPNHNLRDVLKAVIEYIKDNDISEDKLADIVVAPDFNGGIITTSKKNMKEMYRTGRGTIHMISDYKVERSGQNVSVIFNSIPYGVDKSKLIDRLVNMVDDSDTNYIKSVVDESTHDIRIAVDIKKTADPDVVAAYLIDKTDLSSTFSVNMTCLIGDTEDELEPKVLSLKQVISEFVRFRKNTLTLIINNDISKINEKINILNGYQIFLDNFDQVMSVIRKNESDNLKNSLLSLDIFDDENQIMAILSLKISKLSKDSVAKLIAELDDLKKALNTNKSYLKDLDSYLIDDLTKTMIKFGGNRKTKFNPKASISYDEADLINEEDCFIFISEFGFMKRMKTKGNPQFKNNDQIINVLKSTTKSNILLFGTSGRCFTTRAIDIPSGSSIHIGNIFSIDNDERILYTCNDKDVDTIGVIRSDGRALIIKLSNHKDVSNKNGRYYTKINNEKVVHIGNPDHAICAFTKNAKFICSNLSGIDVSTRPVKGNVFVRCIDDDVIHAYSSDDNQKYCVHFEDGSNMNKTNNKLMKRGRPITLKKNMVISKVERI